MNAACSGLRGVASALLISAIRILQPVSVECSFQVHLVPLGWRILRF